jgi:2,4-dienoyl-CoA reductase-like NADH-dependent reductase (Old Yellow Enzyme family)
MMASLLDPLRVGHLELRNRIVMPPMLSGKATPEGHVTDELIQHYARRAADLGLQIVEATAISQTGLGIRLQVRLDSDQHIQGLERLVNAVHEEETPIAVQLGHVGGAGRSEVCGCQPLAPSNLIVPNKGQEVPRAMTLSDIEEVVEDFVQATRRACEAGFDAVEIHGAHGYLLSQFLSPLCNRRDDEYGGSLKNRIRLSLRVISSIRKELGRRYPVLYRLGAEDMLQGGLALDEGVQAATMLAKEGVDIIDVSGGLIGHLNPANDGPGFFVPQAAAIKKTVKVPVIGVGGIKTAVEANAIIQSGQVDLVAVGRAMLKDPKWALKVASGLR